MIFAPNPPSWRHAAHRVLVGYGAIWKLPDDLAVDAIDIGYALAPILFLGKMDGGVPETCQLFNYFRHRFLAGLISFAMSSGLT